jgi:hypothetical protein
MNNLRAQLDDFISIGSSALLYLLRQNLSPRSYVSIYSVLSEMGDMGILKCDANAELRERLGYQMLAGYLRLSGFTSATEVQFKSKNLEQREAPDDVRQMFDAWASQNEPH